MSEFFDKLSGITIGSISLGGVLSAVVLLIVCAIVIKIIMAAINKLLSRAKKLDGTLRGFVASAAKVVLWALAIIIIAGALGIETASLVALLSVVSLALSLSVQTLLTNVFSGLTLLINKPFSEGDLIEVAGKTGIVKKLGLFYTTLDTLDNILVSIPNGDICNASIMNYAAEDKRRVDFTFTASYSSETEDVKAAIREAAAADEKIFRDPEPFIVLSKYNASNIEYIVRVWCRNADYWDVYFGMNERVRETFKAHGVSMTYDHVNVHMVQE